MSDPMFGKSEKMFDKIKCSKANSRWHLVFCYKMLNGRAKLNLKRKLHKKR